MDVLDDGGRTSRRDASSSRRASLQRFELRLNSLADMHGYDPLRHVETDQFLLLIANRHPPSSSLLLNVDELERQTAAQNDVADDSTDGRGVHVLTNSNAAER